MYTKGGKKVSGPEWRNTFRSKKWFDFCHGSKKKNVSKVKWTLISAGIFTRIFHPSNPAKKIMYTVA